MSSRQERREKLMQLQTEGKRGSFKKVLDVPEDKVLKLQPEETVLLDIVPYPIGPSNPLYSTVKADADAHGEVPRWWCFDYAIHKSVPGMEPVICHEYMKTGECAVCAEKRRKAEELGCDWGDKRLSDYNYSKRAAYLVLDLNSEEGEYKILDHSQFHLHNKLTEKAKAENVFFLDETIDGMSVEITPMEGEYKGNKFAGQCMIKFKKREFGLTEEDLADAYDIGKYFNIDSPERVYEILHAITPSVDEDNKEIPAPATEVRTPNTSSRRGQRGEASESVEQESTPTPSGRGRRTRGNRPVTETDVAEDDITF